MIDQRLVDYITQQLQNGVLQDDLKKVLAEAGWQQAAVDEAFKFIQGQNAAAPKPAEAAPAPDTLSERPGAPAQPQSAPAQADSVFGAAVGPGPAPDQIQPSGISGAPAIRYTEPIENFTKETQERQTVPGADPIREPNPPAIPARDFGSDAGLTGQFGKKAGEPSGSFPDKPAGLPPDMFQSSEPKPNIGLGMAAGPDPSGPNQNPVPGPETVPGGGLGSFPDTIGRGMGSGPAMDAAPGMGFPERAGRPMMGQEGAESVEPMERSGSPDLEAKPRKKGKKVFSLILLILGLLLIGGAAAGYFFYYMSPGMVAKRMLSKLDSVKTVQYDGQLTTAGQEGDYEATFNFEGVSDLSDSQNKKTSLSLSYSYKPILKGSQLKIEAIMVAHVVYLKIAQLPDASGGIEVLKDQWIKLDLDEMQDKFDSLFSIGGKEEGGRNSLPFKDLTADQIRQIRALIEKNDLVGSAKRLKEENISGVDCYHYGIEIDKEEIKKFVAGLNEIIYGGSVSETELDYINESIDSITAMAGELWIGKKDNLPYKIMSSSAATDKYGATTNSTFTLRVKNYNAAVEIAAPDQARSLEEIINEAMGNLPPAGGENGSSDIPETVSDTPNVPSEPDEPEIPAEPVTPEEPAEPDGQPAGNFDGQRKSDMQALRAAQLSWFEQNKRYYTCGTRGGDCKGKKNNYPLSIGTFMTLTPADPENSGTVCGRDFIYCALDNTRYPKTFCYYARLSSGNYYTATFTGHFLRKSAPRSFVECGTANAIDMKAGLAEGAAN